MNWLPDDIKEASGGETIDQVARDSIRLAHRVLDRFPDLVRRHKVIAGGAAITSSLVIIAGVALARRMRRGQSSEEALAGITEDELDHPKYTPRPAAPATSAEAPNNGPVPAEEIEKSTLSG